MEGWFKCLHKGSFSTCYHPRLDYIYHSLCLAKKNSLFRSKARTARSGGTRLYYVYDEYLVALRQASLPLKSRPHFSVCVLIYGRSSWTWFECGEKRQVVADKDLLVLKWDEELMPRPKGCRCSEAGVIMHDSHIFVMLIHELQVKTV